MLAPMPLLKRVRERVTGLRQTDQGEGGAGAVLVAAAVGAVHGEARQAQLLGDQRGGRHQRLVVGEDARDPLRAGDLLGRGENPLAVRDEPGPVEQGHHAPARDVRALPGRLGRVDQPQRVPLGGRREQVFAVALLAAADHEQGVGLCGHGAGSSASMGSGTGRRPRPPPSPLAREPAGCARGQKSAWREPARCVNRMNSA
jgi:hypothetical protein